MFEVGFSELLLIGLLALLVLGPERLPELARSAGRWVARTRRFIENVRQDLDREIQDKDLAAFKEVSDEWNEARSLLQKTTQETFARFENEINPGASKTPSTLANQNSVLPSPVATAASRTRTPRKKAKKKSSVSTPKAKSRYAKKTPTR